MKPYVVIINKNEKTDKVTFTIDNFKAEIEKAYKEGYDDGFKEGQSTIKTLTDFSPPYNHLPVYYQYSTTPAPNINPIEITCEAHNTIGD